LRNTAQIAQPSTKTITQVQAKLHVGLIPAPETLREYNEILPGSANRILTMAENQESHRIKMEAMVVKNGSINSTLGLIGGFIVLMTVTLIGGYLILNNKPIEGFGALITGVGGMIFSYLKGIKSQREERLQRVAMLEKITQNKK